jgi:hypothetical protein
VQSCRSHHQETRQTDITQSITFRRTFQGQARKTTVSMTCTGG